MSLTIFKIFPMFLRETSILDFTSELIGRNLNFGSRVVYLGDENINILKSLFNANSTVHYKDKYYLPFDAYLVYFHQNDLIINLFSEKYYFLPHKIIVVFSKSTLQLDHFRYAVNFRGNKVVLVEGYNFNNPDYFIKARVVKTGQIIATSRSNKKFNFKSYKTEKWILKLQVNETVSIGAFPIPPQVYVENGIIKDGVEVRMLNHLLEGYHKTYRLFPPTSWVPVRNLLQNRTCDLVLGAHIRHFANLNTMDVTEPYQNGVMTFLVPKPELLPAETFVFQPLQSMVWIALLVTTLVVATINYIVLKFHSSNESKYIELLIDSAAILYNPSRSSIAREESLKAILVLLNTLAVLITTSYAGGFSYCLTSPRFKKPLDTFQDLFENHIKYNDDNSNLLLRVATSRYANLMQSTPGYYSPNSTHQLRIIHLVDKFIYIHDDNMSLKTKQSLKIMKESLRDMEYVIVLQKNSPLTQKFIVKVRQLVEHGIIKAWFGSYIHRHLDELRESSWYFSYYSTTLGRSPLKVDRLQGAFYTLFFGYIAASAVFAHEVIRNKQTH